MSYYTNDGKYVANAMSQQEYDADQQEKAKTAWQDFGNTRYNSITGATSIKDDTGNTIYSYNPTSHETVYNGTTYAGRYDPSVIGNITGEQSTKAWDDLQKSQDALFKKAEAEGSFGMNYDFKGMLNQGQADAQIMSQLYDQSKKGNPGQGSFFDRLKSASEARNQNAPAYDPLQGQSNNGQLNYKDWYKSDRNSSQSYEDYSNSFGKPAATPTKQLATAMTESSQQAPNAVQPATPAEPDAPVQPDAPTQPDYTGFLQAIYGAVQPSLSGGGSMTGSSSSFHIGPKTPQISSNNASPDFNSSGYNPQSSFTSGQPSGKAPTQPSSQGMTTGQYSSK